jgi:hypothetical protein
MAESSLSFFIGDSGGDDLDASIINLKTVEPAQGALCNPQWAKLCAITGESGCAFVLPGNARVKLLVGAAQIAEYLYAMWGDYDFEKFERESRASIPEAVIESNILHAVINVCAVASDDAKGLAIIIGANHVDASNDLLDKCSKMYKKNRGDGWLSRTDEACV